MWLVTDRGFYSIVDKGDREGYLCVRARVREDLERLFELGPMKSYEGTIEESDYGDYRFRTYVKREDWAQTAAQLAKSIDYFNFKDEVKKKQGAERAGIYLKVWSDLYELQRN